MNKDGETSSVKKIKMKPEVFESSLECSLRTSETCKVAVKLFDLMMVMVMVIPDHDRWKKEESEDD